MLYRSWQTRGKLLLGIGRIPEDITIRVCQVGAVQRATSVNLRQTCKTAVNFANTVTTGRKSPGDEAESASLRRQDPLLSSCKRLTQGQLAIATVMCTSGETTHQLNGAYSCTDVLQLSFRWPVDGA